MTNHLSDEALDDLLIGIGTTASRAHVAECEECSARVASLQSAIDSFNRASLAFSEAQPNRIRVSPEVHLTRRSTQRPVIVAWIAAAALLILGGPAAWHIFAPHPVSAPVVASLPVESETQIAEDNELMKHVNAAIAPDEDSVIDQFDLLKSPTPQAGKSTRTE